MTQQPVGEVAAAHRGRRGDAADCDREKLYERARAAFPCRDARRGRARGHRRGRRVLAGDRRWRCATPRPTGRVGPDRIGRLSRWPARKVLAAAEAAALIPDGAVVTVSSSSGLGCPDAVLAAIGERFDGSGHPRNLTTHPPDRRRRHVRHQGHRPHRQAGPARQRAGRLLPERPVLDAEPPAIWQMITDDQIPAYNIPSGILFDMHREAAAKRPGVLTKVGLDTFVDPRPRGLRHERARRRGADRRARSSSPATTGCSSRPSCPTSRSSAPPPPTSAATSPTSTRAPISAPLDQALAVAQQWRHRHRPGQAAGQGRHAEAARRCTCPGVLVDAIVVAPDQMQTTQTAYDPAISGEDVPRRWQLPSARRWGADKVIARRVAQELRAGDAVNLGFGISAQRAAHPARGGPPRRRHLGDRAGRGRRRAAARLPVRLRGQCRGDRALAASSSPTSRAAASTARCSRSCRSTGTAASTSRKLGVQAARHGRRRRLRRHHRAGAEDRVLRLLHRRRQARTSRTARLAHRREGKVKKLVARRSSTSPSAAGARSSRARTSPTSPSAA